MTMKKRIEWLDFGRGFTIFLVVVAHVLGGIYTNNIYSQSVNDVLSPLGETVFLVIMPIFFSLSGYVYRDPRDRTDYFKIMTKKMINLFVPYAIFSSLYIYMQKIGGVNEYDWGSLLLIWYKPISYLWFLYVLFFIFVLVSGLSLIGISKKVQLVLYLIGFVFVQIEGLNYYIFQTFGWAIFFIIGIFLKRNECLLNKKVVVSSFVVFVVILIVMFTTLGTDHRYYNELLIVNLIPKVFSDIFLLGVYLNSSPTTWFFRYFKKYGRYSLIIYLIHPPVISVARTIILKLASVNVVVLISLLILAGWYVSIFVVFLNKKIPYLNYIFNPYSMIRRVN